MEKDTIMTQVYLAPGPESEKHVCGPTVTLVGHQPAVIINMSRAPGEHGEDDADGQITVSAIVSALSLGAALDAVDVIRDSLLALTGETVEGATFLYNNFPENKE